jgi:capsule polysaccharide export protein KpsE/RkpR
MNYRGGASGPATVSPVPNLPDTARNDGTLERDKFVETFRLVWNRRGTLFRIGLYAMLAGIVVAFLIPTRYQSSAHLMPPDSQSSSLAMAASAMAGSVAGSALGGMASDLLGMKSSSDIFVGILQSRTAQDYLIRQFDLQKSYGARTMEDARRELSGRTAVGVDRKSQIISIEVTDHSPQKAAAMAQAYIEELNRLVSDLSTSSARRERMFLEDRLKTVNQDLEAAEKEFSQFASKNSAIDVKEQGKAMVDAAATLQGNLIAAESEYEGLRQLYTDSNVRVRTVRARIAELQHQLDTLAGKGESTTSVAPTSDSSLYPSIRKLPLLGVTYADLYRKTKIQEAVLEALTREYEMAKVQEAKEIPTVKVLDPPQIPDKKSYPPRLLIIFIVTFSALCVATVLLFVRNAWTHTDMRDERKILVQEVFAGFKTDFAGSWAPKPATLASDRRSFSTAAEDSLDEDRTSK